MKKSYFLTSFSKLSISGIKKQIRVKGKTFLTSVYSNFFPFRRKQNSCDQESERKRSFCVQISNVGLLCVVQKSGIVKLSVGAFPALSRQRRVHGRGSVVHRLLVRRPPFGRVREEVLPVADGLRVVGVVVVVVVERFAFRFSPLAGSSPVQLKWRKSSDPSWPKCFIFGQLTILLSGFTLKRIFDSKTKRTVLVRFYKAGAYDTDS